MRVSDATLYRFYTEAFRGNRENLDHALRQLSDGKRVRRASDDPAGAHAAMELRSRHARLEGLERSSRLARFDLATIDSVLSDLVDLVSEARTTAMEGASTTTDGEFLAAEIDQLRERLLARANTSQGGRYLFSGRETLTAPFDASGAYQGSDQEATAPIDTNRTVGTTLSGQRVFLDGGDLFTALSDLSAALRSGDTAATSAMISTLGTVLDHLNEIHSDVGSRLQAVDTNLDRQSDERLMLLGRISEIEDADLERTILDVSVANQSYDALAASASVALQRSLFDILG